MRRVYILTIVTCLFMLAAFAFLFEALNLNSSREHLTVGFIYDNDESTAYTYNFSLAKDELEKQYGENLDILTCSNVLDEEMEEPLRELASQGCDIIFFNGYSDQVVKFAPEYPDIQFCQTSYMDMSDQTVPSNYHTFKGEAYQGRYVSGVAAGMKIKQMISDGIISEDQAIMGFVAAFPTSEVISGYTAFVLGARSVVPNTVLQVYYTKTWSSYAEEKKAALRLIRDGCVILSQHSDTIAPAVVCEEKSTEEHPVYFVSYNQSMSEVAPVTSLVSSRICWEPYVLSAVEAVMHNKEIESYIDGNIHGTDVSAGFEHGWVEIDELNLQIAAPGTQEAIDEVIDEFKQEKKAFVYKCNLTGVNPDDPTDTYDLSNGYIENKDTSYPLFHYIIPDIITILE